MSIASEDHARAWLAARPEATPEAIARLEVLIALLREENQRQNLVAAASLDSVWQRHIADSAQLLAHVPRETNGPWLDLGTGAGFPGLVVAALNPQRPVLMVESRNRRVEWLLRACEAMGLAQAHVIGSRLELVDSRKVAVISARAFAPLEKLLELSARFSTSDTIWLLPKGRSAGQELATLSPRWQHKFHVTPSLTDAESGIVLGHLCAISGVRS
jgi:16S rRNA (guanine527-N7)-methyltransferase